MNLLNNRLEAEKRPAGARGSFTLVEMLLVLVIITIMVGMTLPVSKYVNQRVQETRREVMREKIISALESYKAEYGEYPINSMDDPQGLQRHYAEEYNIDPDGISIFTNINLTSGEEILILPDRSAVRITTTENMAFGVGGEMTLDYSLSYPLYLKPREQGKTPLISVPEARVKYVVWKIESANWIQPSGIRGNWMKRPLIVDPMTHYQWAYYSSNGLTYQVWINTNSTWSKPIRVRTK